MGKLDEVRRSFGQRLDELEGAIRDLRASQTSDKTHAMEAVGRLRDGLEEALTDLAEDQNRLRNFVGTEMVGHINAMRIADAALMRILVEKGICTQDDIMASAQAISDEREALSRAQHVAKQEGAEMIRVIGDADAGPADLREDGEVSGVQVRAAGEGEGPMPALREESAVVTASGPVPGEGQAGSPEPVLVGAAESE